MSYKHLRCRPCEPAEPIYSTLPLCPVQVAAGPALSYILRREIAERPLVSEGGARMHFIDDRLETVRGIASDAALREAGLRVYFAEWCASCQVNPGAIRMQFDPSRCPHVVLVATLRQCAPGCSTQHVVPLVDGVVISSTAGATAHRRRSWRRSSWTT